MLQGILDVFTKIGEFFTSIFDLVVSLIKDIITLGQLLVGVVTNLPTYLSWIPEGLSATILLALGVVVIYQIVGRE